MNTSPLSPLEARVLGVLIEKQRTVPDTYPLTLNALTAGCNQKTSRDPIMNAGEADVQAAVDRMREDAWIVESSGGRVMRYAHNAERVLAIPAQSVALLAVLLLRGPQTVGELRINCDRLHRFADISAVEAFLHELAARSAGALVVELARVPGARETRWAQLLSGAPTEATAATDGTSATGAAQAMDASTPTSAGDLSALRDDITALQREVEALKAAIAALQTERAV
jgi:uncharacterized protein YceH (UPF0502 family)